MRPTLFRKVFLTYLLTILVGIVVTYFVAWHFARARYEKEIEKELGIVSVLFGRMVANEMPSGERDLQKVAERLGGETGIRVTVVDAEGRVLADSDKNPSEMENHRDRSEIAAAFSSGTGLSVRRSDTLKVDMMYFARKQEVLNNRVVVVRTALPLSGVEERLWDVNRAVIAGFVVTAILALFVGFFAVRRLTNSISQMKEVAQAITSGELTSRASAMSNDEIGELGKALNEMSDALKEKIEKLSEEKSQIETIISSMSDGLVAVDTEGTIVLANRMAEQLLGCTLTPGRRLGEVVRNDEITALLKNALSGAHTEPVHSSTPLGFELELHASAISRGGGALVIVRNVTEARRLERMRKEFVANASHELRTPVTLMKGYIETLNAGVAEDTSKRGQFLTVLEKNVNQLANLIEDLLRLSILEGEKRLRIEESVNVAQLVSEVVEQFNDAASQKGISLSASVQEEQLTVVGDSTLLKQAVANLVDNAVKYTNPDGTVTVSAKVLNGKVAVEVTDTGIGIDKEHLPRIFERFYRVDKSRSRDLGGTGLGLSIVKHVVQAHGGEVSVQSEPGKGSRFTILLPQAK